jgi:hypothetical protein
MVCAFIGQILDGELCTLSVRVPGSSERGEIVRAPIVEASVDGMFRVIGGVLDAFDDAGFEGLVGVGKFLDALIGDVGGEVGAWGKPLRVFGLSRAIRPTCPGSFPSSSGCACSSPHGLFAMSSSRIRVVARRCFDAPAPTEVFGLDRRNSGRGSIGGGLRVDICLIAVLVAPGLPLWYLLELSRTSGRDQRDICARRGSLSPTAGVAQLVEHLICNQRVGGSNPFASSSI